MRFFLLTAHFSLFTFHFSLLPRRLASLQGSAYRAYTRDMADRPKLPRNVWIAGGVSLLNDISSEMIYPLLPLFITGVLKASRS